MTSHLLTPTTALVMLAGLTTFAPIPPAAAGEPVTVALRLDDEAGVPAGVLATAKETVVEICRRAGVRVVWTNSTEVFVDPVRDLRMTIVTSPDPGSHDHAGGFANMTEQFALVFLRKAQEVTVHSAVSTGIVLGHMMAHEIGHMLLPSGSHSRTGIMRAVWTAPDFTNAAQGHLAFTSEQAAVMRARLAH